MKFGISEYRRSFEEEMIVFLTLCSKKDKNFINVPKKKRTVEDYARLILITRIFGLNKVLLRIVAEGEDRMDEICDFIKEYSEKSIVAQKWVEEFIEAIPVPELKKEAEKFWADSPFKVREK